MRFFIHIRVFLSHFPDPRSPDIAQNKIKSISGIRNLTRLRKIDLGANRIRVMDEDELSGLVNLEELWLGKNKIERITGLNSLSKLRRLDVQSNRLTRVEGLEGQVHTLEELYLSHNGINDEGASCPGGLSLMFENLNTIDMSRNRLTSTRPFGHLTSLVDLWISGNDIKTFDDVEDLRRLTNLDSVYLEYNPLDKEFEYRKRLAEMIPSLTQIDANKIGGLAAYGWGGIGGGGFGSMGDPAERMRQMQDMAIRRAELESQQNRYAEEKHAT
jgi:protein phosphatase 1 regulatory subunit 7